MDSVSIAFELMRLELEAESERLNSAGASAFRSSDYEKAEEQIRLGRRLKEFCERVSKLENEWQRGFAPIETADQDSSSPAPQTDVARKILAHSKSSKLSLLVRFDDGTVIAERTAADTLAKAIQKIGFDRVERTGILVNGEAIVSNSKSLKYNDVQIDGHYVKTHSSTSQKARNLLQISEALGLELEIQIID